jgi:hypothetical protein
MRGPRQTPEILTGSSSGISSWRCWSGFPWISSTKVSFSFTYALIAGACKTYLDALKTAFDQHFLPFFSQFDCHKFRKERLWNEECDNTLKRFSKVLAALYAKYSGKYAMPGAQKYMSLDEFTDMIHTSGVIDDSFGAREISPLFNLSMMTQKNELDFDRHFNMTPVEMIEAVARVADKLSRDKLPDPYLEMPCFHKYHLDKKIESLLFQLMKVALPKPEAEKLEKGLKKAIEAELADPIKKKYRNQTR